MRRRWWWMRRPVAAGLSSESAQDDLLDGPTEVVVDGVEDRVDGWIEISHPVAEFDVPSGEKVRHKRWDLQSVPTTHSFNILPTLVSSSTLSLSTKLESSTQSLASISLFQLPLSLSLSPQFLILFSFSNWFMNWFSFETPPGIRIAGWHWRNWRTGCPSGIILTSM